MQNNLAYAAYSQNNAAIESPEKLIEMLYEGILKFASRAKLAINEKDIEKKVYFINKTTAIFAELTNSLNYDAGDIAHYLNGIYARQIQLLTQANFSNSTDELDEVIKVARGLLEAWKEKENV